jgi:PTH1 family peptidyl-tRNA hydrolase
VKLIVGLGNPGPRYARTRHNVGFMVLDELARRHRATGRNEQVIFLKPLTYMNLSGLAVVRALRRRRLHVEDLIVIHDELDLPVGTVRLKQGGGSAGHRGVKSIAEHVGTADFVRVRVGIGRPPQDDAVGHVLGQPVASEEAALERAVAVAADAVESITRDGLERAMNAFNRRGDTSPASPASPVDAGAPA